MATDLARSYTVDRDMRFGGAKDQHCGTSDATDCLCGR
jgi:hypothetical protein